MPDPLRILVVDDSPTARRVVRTMIESDQELKVVGEAANGRDALAMVADLRPDLVILDVRMPVMDGVETTRQIMAYTPTPILVLTASLSAYDIDITFKMLGAGALDVVEKPTLVDARAIEQARVQLIRKVKLLARVRVVTHLRGRRPRGFGERIDEPPGSVAAARPQQVFSKINYPIIVIGASTGGPRVVRQILGGMPAGFSAAVVVVQHIAEGFGSGMVEWWATGTALPVALATENARISPGTVLVAPDRYDLLVKMSGRVHLSGHPLLLQRPSIDITMQSAAEAFGGRTIGVLLTGMGRDGALGLQAIRRVGGYTIAQDEASSTIYGMPRAAAEVGAAIEILSPDQIIRALIERVA